MEERIHPDPAQEPVTPAAPAAPMPPQPPRYIIPVYSAHKKELLFALAMLVSSILLWDFIIAGGFSLGFAIGTVCVIGCSLGYLLSQGHRPGWYSGSLILLSIVIVAGFGRSADGFVKYVMIHFLLVAMNLGLCLLAGRNRWSPGGVGSLIDAPRVLFVLGFGSMSAAGRGLNNARKDAGAFGKKGIAVVLGLIVSVPLMAVLIMLLMRADAAFEGLLDRLPEADWQEFFVAVLFGTLCAWVLYSRGVALHRAPKTERQPAAFRGIHALTVNTILIAVCLVYAVYLVSQLAYFSGGFSGILPEDYTLAQYARRGFFEMAWLCAIDLAVIAAGIGLVAKEGKAPLLTRLLCLFIGLITVFFVTAASAKMLLYIGSYGLTRLRVLTEVIMVFLGASTVLVCLWLFLPKIPYMKVILLLGLTMGAAVLWADVDTQVAKYNVRAYQSGVLETVDVAHLTELGPGAVPYIRELAGDPDPEVADEAQDYLDFCHYSVTDFRDWNLAKAQAADTLDAMRALESAQAAEYLTEQLGLEVPAAEVQKRYGLECLAEAGQTCLVLRFTPEQDQALQAQLEAAAQAEGPWHTFPMSTTMKDILYSSVLGYPHFRDDWSTNILPSVDGGYYFFLDLHPDAADPYDEAAFLARETYHFSVAVYDPAETTLYFLTMDAPS